MARVLLVAVFVLCAPPAAEAAKVRVASMTVNGLRVKNLECELQGGGFMASMQVVGALAKQVKAFKACSKKTVTPRVSWKFAANKTKNVKVVAKDAAVARCVTKTMKKVRAKALEGNCSATLLLP